MNTIYGGVSEDLINSILDLVNHVRFHGLAKIHATNFGSKGFPKGDDLDLIEGSWHIGSLRRMWSK
jgi:hypothetical protein